MQACEPIRQLGALKEELESAQSPIMRTVFAWLFPFGPGWNSGESPRTAPVAVFAQAQAARAASAAADKRAPPRGRSGDRD